MSFSPSHRPPARGFTLIEVLVVIAIIVILLAITVTVGMSVKTNAAIRSTHATLKSLDGMMKDYLADGNPEPKVPAWPYSSNAAAAYAQTNPASDPILWVKLFQADPKLSKQLASLPQGNDGLTPTANTVVLDAFGTPIRYVPADPNTKKSGYFMSAGPDRNFSTSTPPSAPNLTADDLYSYDP